MIFCSDMTEEISHSGRIVKIDSKLITVEIISESACASCHAAALCGMSEAKSKLVDVPSELGYSVGEEVWINMKKTMGVKAVAVAYVYPLFVLVAALLICIAAGLAELSSGLVAIGAVALYYFVIYLLRGKLKNEYTFYIKKKQ